MVAPIDQAKQEAREQAIMLAQAQLADIFAEVAARKAPEVLRPDFVGRLLIGVDIVHGRILLATSMIEQRE